MKKVLSIAVLSLFVFPVITFAQHFEVWNNTACSVSVSVVADPSSGSCSSLVTSNFFTMALGTANVYTSPINLNDATCVPVGPGPGWTGGYCFSSSPSNYWDGATVNVNGMYYVVGNTACFPTNHVVCSNLDCAGNTVTLDWDTSTFPYPVLRIHY